MDDVAFENTAPFPADSLRPIVGTRPSRCSFLGIPVCVPFTSRGREEYRLSPGQVLADIESIERYYRVAGYFGTRAVPSVVADGDNVDVTFTIERGDPIVLDALSVTGTDSVYPADSIVPRLPLKLGGIFHLGRFLESSEILAEAMRRRGHANVQVLRSFTVDTIDNRAEASLEVAPGPQVRIDSIIVTGAPHLGRSETLRQLEFRPGDVLISTELLESQRNLYSLELVSLASVTVAPDSLQASPGDDTRATVIVQVAEAPIREVDAAIGFGTEECLRVETGVVHRSFGGGARRLGVRGSASRIGAGDPFRIGAGDWVCSGGSSDSTSIDYRFSADFTQPYFLGPRNQLGLTAFAERLSEPGVFTRVAVGGRVGVSRRLGARSGISGGVELERGETRAAPALFCAAFLVCEPATIDSLSVPRLRNEVGLNYFLDRSNAPLDPTSGYLVRGGIAWAAPWLDSQTRFFRATADGAAYRTLRPGWVLAASLRAGNFFRTATLNPTDNYLPPEERFYAGGATSVRGFDRNGLGPGVYVTDGYRVVETGDTIYESPRFVPTGGTALAIASTELRMPSPVLGELLRLAVFVDAGALDSKSLWALGSEDWKITPGVGLRMRTPVGPVRLDIGYNPYDKVTGPILFSEANTGRLIRLTERYSEPVGGFWNRVRIHLGVGNPF